MYAVFFRFAGADAISANLRSAHERWIEQSLHEGILVVAGRSMRDSGCTLLVQGLGLSELQARLRVCPLAGAVGTRVEVQEISTFMNEACRSILESREDTGPERTSPRRAHRTRNVSE